LDSLLPEIFRRQRSELDRDSGSLGREEAAHIQTLGVNCARS
jgi:hypothetical protein